MKTKKTILTTILAMTFLLSSQMVKAQFPLDPETGKVQFTGVIDMPGMTKDALLKKAKFWLVTTLKSSDNMVDLNGTNTDHIVGAGNIYLDSIALNRGNDFANSGNLSFKFILYFKDNKLKYSLENFFLQYSFSIPLSGLVEKEFVVQTGLEDLKTASGRGYYISEKNLLFYKEHNTVYIKSIIERLVTNFITSMKKSGSDNW